MKDEKRQHEMKKKLYLFLFQFAITLFINKTPIENEEIN